MSAPNLGDKNGNHANRIQTLTYPSGAVVTYQYDGAGQVTGVTLTRGAITEDLASNVTYVPFGPVKGLAYGNGNVLTQTFDSAYRVTAQTVPGVLDLTYPLYDAAGNLRRRDDALASPMLQDYVYDAYNRLDTATGAFGSRDYDYDKNGNRTQLNDGAVTGYAYEPGGNRLDSVGSDNVVLDANGNTLTNGPSSYTYTGHNRLQQVSNTGGVLMTYTYNGLGQRVQKRAPGGAELDFSYGLDGQLLAETAATGEALVEYVWLNGQPLAMLSQDRDKDGVSDELDNCIDRPNGPLQPDRGGFSQRDTDGDGYGNACDPDLNNDGIANSMDLGIMAAVFFTNDANADFNGDGIVNSLDLGVMSQLFFKPPGPSGPNGDASAATPHAIHTDHLGTPVAMTDGAGTVVWKAAYDPFGSATVNEDPDGDGVAVVNNLRFPGQYYDNETGLHQNGFRTYDPETGRYITADPIGLIAGPNLYTYVYNNPTRWMDPLGLDVTTCLYPGLPPHIGLGVNGSDTTGRRTDGTSDLIDIINGKDVPGEVSRDSGKPSDCTTTQTTPEQNERVQQFIDNHINNPGQYNLYNRSCVDFVRDPFEQILSIPLGDSNLPTEIYRDIFFHNNQ